LYESPLNLISAFRISLQTEEGKKELSVTGFPPDIPSKKVECRLKKLSTNCGGRVVSVTRKLALLRFASEDDAIR